MSRKKKKKAAAKGKQIEKKNTKSRLFVFVVLCVLLRLVL